MSAAADAEPGPIKGHGPAHAGPRQTLEAVLGIPFTDGNRVEVLRNGDEIFPAMLDAIAAARSSIDFLTFVYWTGDIARRFADALSKQARAGVAVRVLLDGIGARPMRHDLIEEMEAAGVEVRWFRKPPAWRVWSLDNRTHRKVLVVDGAVAFTGGVGIAEEWEGDARNPSEWRDSHFRVEGPAVQGIHGAFWGNWMEVEQTIQEALSAVRPQGRPGDASVQIVRSTASIGWSDIAMLIDCLICLAEKRLRICTAYFAPDDMTVRQLIGAAERGVAVEIMIPGKHIDTRTSELAGSEAFTPLMQAGVTMWRYQRTMLHTKVITVDGGIACIGSPNLNQRSMRQDDEVAMVVDDAALVRTLDAHFDEDLTACEAIRLHRWRDRGPLRRIREGLARIVKRES